MSKNDIQNIKILFVCMGNICRSPSAEAVMTKYIKDIGLSKKITCDSAGTISHHAGEPADARMISHANKRNYNLTSISRQITPADFEIFDYIIAMDKNNISGMMPFMPNSKFESKITKMTNYCTNPNPGYIPDPYYGGADGFEKVLDLLEDACQGLLNTVIKDNNL